jgi:hypothetical protein
LLFAPIVIGKDIMGRKEISTSILGKHRQCRFDFTHDLKGIREK